MSRCHNCKRQLIWSMIWKRVIWSNVIHTHTHTPQYTTLCALAPSRIGAESFGKMIALPLSSPLSSPPFPSAPSPSPPLPVALFAPVADDARRHQIWSARQHTQGLELDRASSWHHLKSAWQLCLPLSPSQPLRFWLNQGTLYAHRDVSLLDMIRPTILCFCGNLVAVSCCHPSDFPSYYYSNDRAVS